MFIYFFVFLSIIEKKFQQNNSDKFNGGERAYNNCNVIKHIKKVLAEGERERENNLPHSIIILILKFQLRCSHFWYDLYPTSRETGHLRTSHW